MPEMIVCISSVIATRPSNYSSVSLIANDERISLLINNHICWKNQLIRSMTCSISTCYHLTCPCIRFPFNNTMIPTISNINTSLMIININTFGTRELMESIALLISSSNSETMLSPFRVVINVRRSTNNLS